MHTFEQVGELLDDIVDSLPEDFFRDLNGGVYLSSESKHNDKIPSENYWVLGEYQVNHMMGRSICLYYGSLMALYVDASVEDLSAQLKKVVLHEFRHHIESLAGNHDLEIEDAIYVQKALDRLDGRKSPH